MPKPPPHRHLGHRVLIGPGCPKLAMRTMHRTGAEEGHHRHAVGPPKRGANPTIGDAEPVGEFCRRRHWTEPVRQSDALASDPGSRGALDRRVIAARLQDRRDGHDVSSRVRGMFVGQPTRLRGAQHVGQNSAQLMHPIISDDPLPSLLGGSAGRARGSLRNHRRDRQRHGRPGRRAILKTPGARA